MKFSKTLIGGCDIYTVCIYTLYLLNIFPYNEVPIELEDQSFCEHLIEYSQTELRPGDNLAVSIIQYRCNRPEYTPGRIIPGVMAA